MLWKILDQIDPQTNTMREDAFNRLVERCSEIITPDEPYHAIDIVFEDIVSLPIDTNVIEFIRGFNNYIENIMSSALLGSCYIAKNQTLKVLIQTSESVNPDKIKHFSRNYIQSSLKRNIPLVVEHRPLKPLGGVSYWNLQKK